MNPKMNLKQIDLKLLIMFFEKENFKLRFKTRQGWCSLTDSGNLFHSVLFYI